MTGEEWEAERQLLGNGTAPQVEAYPFQGVDLATRPYSVLGGDFLLHLACAFVREDRANGLDVTLQNTALDRKYVKPGAGYEPQRSPFGTRVAQLVRLDREGVLASKCGNCQRLTQGCRCSIEGPGIW